MDLNSYQYMANLVSSLPYLLDYFQAEPRYPSIYLEILHYAPLKDF